jgi:hypothetical protein
VSVTNQKQNTVDSSLMQKHNRRATDLLGGKGGGMSHSGLFTLLLHIWEVLGSNLSPETSYPD